MRSHLVTLLGVVISVFSANALASAAISPVGQFDGDYSEGFESFGSIVVPGPQNNLSGPMEILANHATLTGIHPALVRPLAIWSSIGGFSLDDKTPLEGNVRAVPFDGTHGLHLVSSVANPVGRMDFHAPVSDFGGYWVHAVTQTMGGPVTITFFDEANAVIGSEQFSYDYENLQGISQWFGWSSTTPIHAVAFTGFWAGVDGVQINIVPEPSAIMIACVGVFALASCRTVRRVTCT